MTPVSGGVGARMEDRRSHFSHKSETIRPDYYRVYLGDWDIKLEVTAARRSAVMRITYGDTAKPGFVVDAMGGDGKVRVDAAKRRVYGVSKRRRTPVADDFGTAEDPEFRIVKLFCFADGETIREFGRRAAVLGMPYEAIPRQRDAWELVPAG